MRIEIIHMRDPDSECGLHVFVDGEPYGYEHVYDVDAGRGHTRRDWDETTAVECAAAPGRVGEMLREIRDAIAETSPYITDD